MLSMHALYMQFHVRIYRLRWKITILERSTNDKKEEEKKREKALNLIRQANWLD